MHFSSIPWLGIGSLSHQSQSRKPEILHNKREYLLGTKPRVSLKALETKMLLLRKSVLDINTLEVNLYIMYSFLLLQI